MPRRSIPRPSIKGFKQTSLKALFWDLLTFDRLMTGPVIHIIYWCGLALLVLGGFSVIGGAVGVALREPGVMSWILAVPVLVAGLLVLLIMGLLWRSFCELYVALFRIADDLRVMRSFVEQDHGVGASRSAPAPAPAGEIGDRADADLVSKI